jgi:hypothetical protein
VSERLFDRPLVGAVAKTSLFLGNAAPVASVSSIWRASVSAMSPSGTRLTYFS